MLLLMALRPQIQAALAGLNVLVKKKKSKDTQVRGNQGAGTRRDGEAEKG